MWKLNDLIKRAFQICSWTWQRQGLQRIIQQLEVPFQWQTEDKTMAKHHTAGVLQSRLPRKDIHESWDSIDWGQTLHCKTEKQRAEQLKRRRRREEGQASGSAFIITWLACTLHRVRVMGKDALIGSSPPQTVVSIPFLLNNPSVSFSVQFLLSHNVPGSSNTAFTQCMWNSPWTKVWPRRFNLEYTRV